MSEKVTTYDISYIHNNPFENITSKILLDNLKKVNTEDIINKNNEDNSQSFSPETKFSSLISVYKFCKSYFDNSKNLKTDEIKKLYKKKSNALTYNDWLNASLKLDQLENNDLWKNTLESDLYDYKLVQSQLNDLRTYRLNHDYDKILFIIRNFWKRDFAGLNNELLYMKSHVGTKTLIKDYIEECINCLESLTSLNCNLDDNYILEILLESKRNYGRGAITMSGGGTFGLIGIGVFSTLLENDLFPKIISGSSCGSIVSSIMCSKTSDEIKSILSSLFDKTFEVFNVETDHDTFYTHLSRLLKFGVWFDSKYLQETMKQFLGNITFREAYNKTGRILNITVSSATIHDQPTLLNYLTAPNVLIWSAVCASCSLPIIFASSTIYEKNVENGEINEWSNPLLKFVDGSLNSDLPISRLSEMFNVNHTIACQVNPHIAPLVKFSLNNSYFWNFKSLVFKIANLLSLELSHYCDILIELGLMNNLATKLKQLILQSYIGDITILPQMQFGDESKTLVNPTPKFIWDCILQGAKATWPKLSIIKDQYSIEFAMDKYISILKSRVVFESNSKNILMPCETSVSSFSSPKKYKINESIDLRKRGESITLSEKLRNCNNNNNNNNNSVNLSPFSSKVNLYKQQRSPHKVKLKNRKGLKIELSVSNNPNESNISNHNYLNQNKNKYYNLRPDHSFESLRNIQKIADNKSIGNSKKKHTRSLSYTLVTENHPNVLKDEETIRPLINNENESRRSSASSAILIEPDSSIILLSPAKDKAG